MTLSTWETLRIVVHLESEISRAPPNPTQPNLTSSHHLDSSIPHTLPLSRLNCKPIRASTQHQYHPTSHRTTDSNTGTNSHPKSPHNRLALNPTPNIALRTVQIAVESQHLLELAVLEVDGRLASFAVGNILGAGGEF